MQGNRPERSSHSGLEPESKRRKTPVSWYSLIMISKSVSDTEKLARDFAAKIVPHPSRATIVALYGDLGSGKTTFTKAFAGALGISPAEVTSPTFIIQKSFDLSGHRHFKRFVHIDAYRIERLAEVSKIGWNETSADKEALILIEWPENISTALPDDAVKIYFTFVDENTREIVFA
jgi:tRNA threonylcarbamoyladenosine biosynthesis protein TsaE